MEKSNNKIVVNTERTITIFEEKEMLLFQSDLTKKPEIELLYDNQKIQGNLLLLEYVIYIAGSSDVEIEENKNSLTLTLPQRYCWRDINMLLPFEDINIKYSFSGRKVSFDGNINLNKNVSFRIQSIIEKELIEEKVNATETDFIDITNDVGILRQIEVCHDIENLSNVRKKKMVFSNNLDDFAFVIPLIFLLPMTIAYFFNIHSVFSFSIIFGIISIFLVISIMWMCLIIINLYINHFKQRFYFKEKKDFFD
jgi:hypothetical protein